MKFPTFLSTIQSSLDLKSINEFFKNNRDLTLEILQSVRSEGRLDADRFKLASVDGGAGGSFDFNLTSHNWGDWAKNEAHYGLVNFLSATLKCSNAQAIAYLVDKKFLDKKEVKKSLSDSEGNPLVFPIPEEMQPWEKVLESRALRKDVGIISDHWEYRDTNGLLLGYKIRIDNRRTNKEIYTLTYRAESGWAKKEWQKGLLPAYGLEKLTASPNIRILIVEGDKAADRAQQILGDRWKVLGFSGIRASDSLWLPDDPFWENVEVVIWPDNDTAGVEAARKIQLKLQGMNNKPRVIKIVRVDKLVGVSKGWDLGDWTEDSSVDVRMELENAEEADSFEAICREWIYVAQQDGFYNLQDRDLIWSVSAFDRRYSRFAEKNASPSKKFLINPESEIAEDLDFIPGKPALLSSASGKKFLNEWYPSDTYRRGLELAADPTITDEEIEENCKYFRAHVERICQNQEVEPDLDHETSLPILETEGRSLVDAFTTHLSEIVKKPMEKRGWIPMLVSENNGTGKTYFVRLMSSVLGNTRATTITVKEFISEYQDWMDGTLFYELGEAKSQNGTEVYDQLKKLHSYLPFSEAHLTDRKKNTHSLNIKSKAKKSQRDFLNGYITSNDLFPLAFHVSKGQQTTDRRLLVIRCEEILTEEQTIELFDQELETKAEWICAYLLRYKRQYKWNPSWAPMTEHKRIMFEKDRERAEQQEEKQEVGRHDDFYRFIEYAKETGLGGFKRKVITTSVLRNIAEGNRVDFPFKADKLESILKKCGLHYITTMMVGDLKERVYSVHEPLPDLTEKDILMMLREDIGEKL